ncbi:hypothetical protein BD770DRAFT_377726 [Pilaira anomala]|nr:hypothetical protein BD770DRAFT_377726 [Pilaira anomala]
MAMLYIRKQCMYTNRYDILYTKGSIYPKLCNVSCYTTICFESPERLDDSRQICLYAYSHHAQLLQKYSITYIKLHKRIFTSSLDLLEKRGDSVVEEKLKKTARRILEFIDLKQKTGMQQDQAKEKAREIIKSIKQETIFQEKEELEEKKDVDIISFETRAIAQVARTERSQLQQQLKLLQTRLVNGKDTDLVISALKLEIDQLRANAENKVRKRTDQAVSQINEIISPTSPIGIEMIQQIQKARRDALKDLRIVYRDIYQINQLIEDMRK